MGAGKVLTMQLPRILDQRGNLSVFENDQYFPFEIKQVAWFWTTGNQYYDAESVAEPFERVIVVLSGSLTLLTGNDSVPTETVLNENLNCIYIPPFTACRVKYCAAHTLAFITTNAIHETGTSFINIFRKDERAVLRS